MINNQYIRLLLLIIAFACSQTLQADSPVEIKASDHQVANTCPDWQPHAVITLDKSLRLPKGCSYKQVSLKITQANIHLDCNGAVFNGLPSKKRNSYFIPYSKADAPKSYGLLIEGTEKNKVNNITVERCRFENYVDGIRVVLKYSAKTHLRLKQGRNSAALEQQLRQLAPSQIMIRNTDLIDSHKHGIFVHRYVNALTFDTGKIKRSGNSGIYLESGTKSNTIVNSVIYKNGYFNYKNRMRQPKLVLARREGIAIDSSSHNVLRKNQFIKNARGSVFLYKNCYEKHTHRLQLPRLGHSDHNRIEHNQFTDEKIGIWVAARQSKDQSGHNCGDKVMYERSGLFKSSRFYEDFAKHTRIQNNTFKNVLTGIRVEDDFTRIHANVFQGESIHDVLVGTPIRSVVFNHPVTGTNIQNNQHASQSVQPVKVLKYQVIQ